MPARGAPPAKVARGGSAHGDGSDGVGAVVEEVLKTKTDEQQQRHSKEGGKAPGGSLPTSQAVIMAAQPSLKSQLCEQ